MTERYVIWSTQHQAWWKRGRVGYTRRFSDAGVYPQTVAITLCATALPGARDVPPEVPIRLDDLEAMRAQNEGRSSVLDP